MILFLRALFIVVLASMIGVTSWASLQCPLFGIPREVYAHPWFVATLFDAYWGFTTFFVWVCYQQRSWLARIAWFVAIMLLGNLAMASYCLAQLFRTPPDGRVADLLTRRHEGAGVLGPVLALLGGLVVWLGYPRS